MEEKYSVEKLEPFVFQIAIADLANTNNPQNFNEEIIEFSDVKISFEMFKNCFFDNNYQHFELNDQFRNLKELGINEKLINHSSFFKNYIGGTKVNIIDILILKYMKNKKTRLDDISRISLIKDFNTYDSLLDFKIYNNQLALDDILTLFNLYNNKAVKKFFRFKIKATYYSTVIDETISMYFNYLVDIPKCFKDNIIKEKITNIEYYQTDESDEVDEFEKVELDEVHEVQVDEVDQVEEPKKNVKLKTKSLKQPVKKLVETPVKEVENLVYSNYIKKQNSENINIDIKDLMLYNSMENISDDDDDEDYDDDEEDDKTTDSNLTTTSFEVNDEDESFFLK